LVGQGARMPDIMVLISTLGGIFLFGAVGFIIGPIVAALFLGTLSIYGEIFSDTLGQKPRSMWQGDLDEAFRAEKRPTEEDGPNESADDESASPS